uniref:Coatomer alpha subunit C-terminal domain-containing protein n=1 Tax=Romanomermis culicivorax TaxID=13658 RepID=A0A915KQI5_ROMCU
MSALLVVQFVDLHGNFLTQLAINRVPNTYDVSQQKASLTKSVNDQQKLNYDEHNPFTVCSQTFVPLYRGKACVKCPFCSATYAPQFSSTLCQICNVAEIGKDCAGLKISAAQFK